MRTRWTMITLLSALLGVVGCAAEAGTGSVDDDGPGSLGKADGTDGCEERPDDPDCYAPPLEDHDSLFDGVPSNDVLRSEARRDDTYPPRFDLVALQSPIRSQQRRGVCSIFSTVGLMEHLYISEGTITEPDFSEQFLQWSAKVEVGSFPNTGGSNARSNLRAIRDHGIVWESDWPYEGNGWGTAEDEACTGDDQPTQCYTNGDPPQDALEARRFHLPAGRWINSTDRSIKAHMVRNETAVVVGLTFFYQSWNHGRSQLPTSSEYSRAGYVLSPNAEDERISLEKRAGHSIVLVGWDDDLEVQRRDEAGELMVDEEGNPVMEKGFFLFKNSWGTGRFGTENPFGDGYGWISYAYVVEHGSAYVSGTPVDVEPIQPVDPEEPEEPVDPGGDAAMGTYENDSATEIPDNDATGIASEIEVTEGGVIGDLTVSVHITHTYRGDLAITLVAPNGAEKTLLDREGGSADDVNVDLSIDDFDGADAAGTWQLRVSDRAGADTGTLNGWSLEFGG